MKAQDASVRTCLFVVLATSARGQAESSPKKHWYVTPPVPVFAPTADYLTVPRYPEIAVAPDGWVYVAAWAGVVGDQFLDIHVRARDPSGQWQPPKRVSHESRWLTGYPPKIATTRDGLVLVAWPGFKGGGVRAVMRVSDDHARSFAKLFDAGEGVSVLDLDLAVDDRDVVHLAYTALGVGGNLDIFYRHTVDARGSGGGGSRADLDASDLSPPENLTSDRQDNGAVQVSASGGATCFAFASQDAKKSKPSFSELMLRSARSGSDRIQLQGSGLQVSIFEDGTLACLFIRAVEAEAKQFLVPGRLDSLLMERQVPSSSTVDAMHLDGNALHVGHNGRVVVAAWCFDAGDYVELKVSDDLGQTFGDILDLSAWAGMYGPLQHSPSIAVEDNGTIHLAFVGVFVDEYDGDFILYTQARYE